MCSLTLKKAAAYCGGTVSPEYENLVFTGVRADSRQICPGQLFAALVAQRDGHDFAATAMQNGAVAVLAQRPLPGIPTVLVKDTLVALQQLAQGWREELPGTVIGITGSVGKTTVKDMTAAVLETTYKTCKTQKNYNNDIGVAQSILDVDKDSEYIVTEMGMSHFHDMSRLTAIARPDMAVIVNIGTMHIENLGSRENICKAKLEILEGLRSSGRLLLCGDEPLLRRDYGTWTPLYFGIADDCALRATEQRLFDGGVSFRAVGMGEDFVITVPIEGSHIIADALAATAVGLSCKVKPQAIQAALAAFQSADRQQIYEKNGYTVIADTYNAGPESMAAALQVLKAKKTAGQRIAVLGDMLELGDFAPKEHERIGRLAAEAADAVLVTGSYGGCVVRGAKECGYRAATCYPDKQTLATALSRLTKPGDVLLFKGSRGMKMEEALRLFFEDKNTKENTP